MKTEAKMYRQTALWEVIQTLAETELRLDKLVIRLDKGEITKDESLNVLDGLSYTSFEENHLQYADEAIKNYEIIARDLWMLVAVKKRELLEAKNPPVKIVVIQEGHRYKGFNKTAVASEFFTHSSGSAQDAAQFILERCIRAVRFETGARYMPNFVIEFQEIRSERF